MAAADAAAPWLSVVVPAHNAAAHIDACLRSVLAQLDAMPGVELLVLDDASTDDTRARVAALVASHPHRVRLLHQPANGGISAARNRLLAEARGRCLRCWASWPPRPWRA